MRLGSLRTRVVIAAVCAVALALAIAGTVVVSTFSSRERDDLDRQLVGRANAVLQANAPVPGQPVPARGPATSNGPVPTRGPANPNGPPFLRRLNSALQSGGELARFEVGGRTILQFGARPTPGVPWPVPSRADSVETVTVKGVRYRAFARKLRNPPGGGSGQLQVATPLKDVESRISALRRA